MNTIWVAHNGTKYPEDGMHVLGAWATRELAESALRRMRFEISGTSGLMWSCRDDWAELLELPLHTEVPA